ncbi:MAG: hypothetical protein ABEJ43_08505 [Haloferacaceae archaeon]
MDEAEDEGGAAAAPSGEGDLLDEAEERDLETLRAEVEEAYDFDEFGPAEMAQMSGDEWEAVFDADTWITGADLLDRVEADLKSRIARRDVFAAVDRVVDDGTPMLAAWSDEGYALVSPDGSIEGAGTVLRDVKATVALCSMESYDPKEPPSNYELPTPEDVESGSGEFGNLMLQVVAGAQVLAGLGLGLAWALGAVGTIVAPVVAGVFVLLGLFLFGVVANARLSDRFRAEEFRERLRAVEEAGDRRPEFLPGGEDGRESDRETEAD